MAKRARGRDEPKVDGVLGRARAALEAYDYPMARELLEESLERSDGAAPIARALAELLVDHLGCDAEALALWPRLRPEAQADPRTRRPLAEAAARSGDTRWARQLIAPVRTADAAPVWAELGRRWLAAGELDAVPGCLEELRELAPASGAVQELERGLEEARAELRAPQERALEELASGDAPSSEVKSAALELLQRWPGSERAARVLREAEQRARAEAEADALARARRAEGRGDLAGALAALTAGVTASEEVLREAERLRAEMASARRAADAEGVREEFARDRRRGLVRYAQADTATRERLDDLDGPEVTLLRALPPARDANAAEALVLEVERVREAERALAGGRPAEASRALERLEGLRDHPSVTALGERVIAALQEAERERRDAVVRRARELLDEGETAAAREALRDVPSDRAQELVARIEVAEAHQRRLDAEAAAVARRDWMAAREAARRLAESAADEARRARWASRADEHDAALRRAHGLSVIDGPVEPPPTWRVPPDSTAVWRTPGGEHLVCPTCTEGWVFLRWIRVADGGCDRAVRLRFRMSTHLETLRVLAESLLLVGNTTETIELSSDGSQILHVGSAPATARIETVEITGQATHLWINQEDSTTLVVDRSRGKVSRRFTRTGWPRPVDGRGDRVLLDTRPLGGRNSGDSTASVDVRSASGLRAEPGRLTVLEGESTSGAVELRGGGLLVLARSNETLTLRRYGPDGSADGALEIEDVWVDGHHALAWSRRGARLLYVGDDGWRLREVGAEDEPLALSEAVRIRDHTTLVRDPAGRWPTLATFRGDAPHVGDEQGPPWSELRAYELPMILRGTEPVPAPEAGERASQLRRWPESLRLDAARRALGDRPTEAAVVATATALRDVLSYEHARTLLREHLLADPSRDRIAVELARLLPLAHAKIRELLEPYADAVRTSGDGTLLGWLLGTARLADGEVEGSLAVLRAGAEAGTRGAEHLREILADLEAVYGEVEPEDPRLRLAHRGLRLLARADAHLAAGDFEGAPWGELRELVRRGDGLGDAALLRVADWWIRREAPDEAATFSKLETLSHIVARLTSRFGRWLPVPSDPYREPSNTILGRARAYLDAMTEEAVEPDWIGELDAALDESEPAPLRLVWRLERVDGWMVRPYVRRVTGRGRLTPGRRADPSELPAWSWVAPLDAAVASVALTEAPASDRLARVLELLRDQAHLELGGQVVRQRWHPPTLALGSEGATLVLTRGETVTANAALAELDGSHHMLRIDESSAQVDVWRFDESHLRILTALAAHADTPRSVLARRLARLARRFALELPEELRGPEVPADGRVHLRAEWRSDELRVRAFLRPAPGGPPRSPGRGREVTVGVVDGVVVHVRRDLPEEAERVREQCADLGLDPDAEAHRWVLAGREAALDLVARAGRAPDRYVIEWDGEPLTVVRQAGARALRVTVEADAHRWLTVDGALDVDGELVQLGHLVAELSRGWRFVRIEGHRFVQVEARLREWARALGDLGELREDGTVRLGAALAPWLREEGVTVDGDARWDELAARFEAAETAELPALGPLDEILWPFQRAGVRWLHRLGEAGMGACLADDMGLGKTLQALGLLAARAARGPALVVAPTSVMHPWSEHARDLAPALCVHLHHGPGRRLPDRLGPGDLVVTSYGVLVQDRELFAAHRFATLVLDEAQALKNPRSRRYRAVRELDVEIAVALTGTPLENHLGELWSLFSIVEPTLLGGWARFRARFAGPIERRRDPAARERLARVLRPYLLRRTKSEVLPDLPPRTTSTLWIEPSPAERAVYEAVRARALDVADGADRMELLAALTRLRQLACDVRLVDPSADAPSTKLRTLSAVVGELREAGHRAVVFSQFVRLLDRARADLEAIGVRCAELTGATPAAERAALADSLDAGDFDVLLVSLKAGGTGLTLTGASYVIHLDPWWNPAVEDQASDRAHRIGQTQPVTVLRLVSTGTIEEAVLAMHEEKRALVDGVLEGGAAGAAVTREELLALMSPPPASDATSGAAVRRRSSDAR